jgi:RING finger protein 113A
MFKKPSGRKIKRRRVQDDHDGNDSNEESNVDGNKMTVTSTKKPLLLSNSSIKDSKQPVNVLGVAFDSSGTASSISDNTATRTLSVDSDNTPQVQENDNDQVYKGLASYKEYINKKVSNPSQQTANGIRAGPLRTASYLRISSRFDYAPDVCKDYKDSGYCGFGDNCKFMHDRSDYKSGWQLEKEWQAQKLKNDPNKFIIDSDDEVSSQEHDSDDDLPFACLLCKGDFKSPIMTLCKHYFCESCALKQYAKTPKCACCGDNTKGVFNQAKLLISKLQAKRKRLEEQTLLVQQANKEEDPLLQ